MNSHEQSAILVRDRTNFRAREEYERTLKPKQYSIHLRQPSASEAPEGIASMPFITLREREHEHAEPVEAKVRVQQDKFSDSERTKARRSNGSMTVRELQALLARQDPDMTVFFFDARMMSR